MIQCLLGFDINPLLMDLHSGRSIETYKTADYFKPFQYPYQGVLQI